MADNELTGGGTHATGGSATPPGRHAASETDGASTMSGGTPHQAAGSIASGVSPSVQSPASPTTFSPGAVPVSGGVGAIGGRPGPTSSGYPPQTGSVYSPLTPSYQATTQVNPTIWSQQPGAVPGVSSVSSPPAAHGAIGTATAPGPVPSGSPTGLYGPGYPSSPAQPGYTGRTSSGGSRLATLAMALALAIGGGVVGGTVVHVFDDDATGSGQETTTAAQTGSVASLADVAAMVQDSVVTINVRMRGQEGGGSGVVISDDGLVLTNNHVVSGARDIEVVFSDGEQADATVVATDPDNDLAVIEVMGASGLEAATLGDSDNLRVGETVLAVGSPLGLDGTVTAGIISAVHRSYSAGEGAQRVTIHDAIQTDAPINPGNSGGPLVNMAGEVIGINSGILTNSQVAGNIGLGFAIPINTAQPLIAQAQAQR